MNLRLACDIAVSKLERDPGPERERLRATLGALADLDRRIDALGAGLKRMGG